MEGSLNEQLSKLRDILSAMRSKQFWETLPLVDDTKDHDVVEIQEIDVPGLKHLKMSIQKEIETIESHLAFETKNGSSKTLSTNSLYYSALWNEVLLAPRPIIALNRSFDVSVLEDKSSPSKSIAFSKKEAAGKAKVDIVAENGRTWIRVNSTKESRLLAEFRNIEAFGYESSDDEDQTDDDVNEHIQTHGRRNLPLEKYLDNSIYETGRLLHLAAQQSSIETGYIPTVHLRLSRLGSTSADERILYNIDKLRELGVIVGPNESPPPTLQPTPSAVYMPLKVNLDLSLLIALVTDITHAPLPATSEEAEERFSPQTERSWKRQLEKNPDVSQDAMEHCRQLIEQTIHEMKHGLVQIIYARFQNHPGKDKVQFWVTEEARDRFVAIVNKIGGPEERLRAQALFSNDNPHAFWKGSRIPAEQRPNLLPIRILPTKLPAPSIAPARTFHQQLALTCQAVLTRPTRQEDRTEDPGNKLPAPMRFAARLSAHTVQSLLWGAELGMVTLTSNKTSVRLLLREMRGFALPSVDVVQNGETERETPMALWVMEPRSLSQSMRNDILATEMTDG